MGGSLVIKKFKSGDVVLVISQDTPRAHCPSGREMAVFPGKDEHVREAKIEIVTTISKCILLESK